MTTDVLLAAHDLFRSYGRHAALRGIDLELRRGEVLGFLGLNGAGKTTTLEILAGALAPDRGSVTICGHDLNTAAAAARRELGYLPQSPALFNDMRVDDYLTWCGHAQAMVPAAIAPACARVCAETGLNDHRTRLVGHLSGGYRQRLGLAQALLPEPAVLLLDEPTAGLDPAQIRDVHKLLRDYAREHGVLISSHILAEVQALADRAVILHHGLVVHDATLARTRGNIRVAFQHDPPASALSALAGVGAVTAAPGGGWLLETEADNAGAIAAHAINAGWGLLELVPDFNALEHHFLRLTAGGAPVPT